MLALGSLSKVRLSLLFDRIMFSQITGLRLVDLNFSAIYGIAYPDVQNLTRLAYDGSRDQVYWSDASKMEIIRAFVNSSGVETAIGVGKLVPA